jgi:hypothetical protein
MLWEKALDVAALLLRFAIYRFEKKKQKELDRGLPARDSHRQSGAAWRAGHETDPNWPPPPWGK